MSKGKLLLLGGGPGSGKSSLGFELIKSLSDEYNVEHLSLGNRVRDIAALAVASVHSDAVQQHMTEAAIAQPLPDEAVNGIVREFLMDLGDISSNNIVLMDGFPRFVQQVPNLFEIARGEAFGVLGLINITVPHDIAIQRMLQRGERPITRDEAEIRLNHFTNSYGETVATLAQEIPVIELSSDVEYGKMAENALASVQPLLADR